MRYVTLLGLALAIAIVPLRAAEMPTELRVSAIPDADPTKLLQVFEPLATHLSERIGIPVRFTPVAKYELTVEGLAAGKLDLVWFGGYTSVQAIRLAKGNAERIAMRTEDATFKSVFIAGTQSGITRIEDLSGKTFAFGANSSTSGHLMPRHFLQLAGLDPDKLFKRYAFTGAHDKTAKLVESGAVDAGALNHLTWENMVAKGEIDPAKVQVFWTTPAYADYCWVMRRDLPADLRAKVKAALLELDPENPAHKAMLDNHGATRYIEAHDDQWQGIEAAARAAGMLTD